MRGIALLVFVIGCAEHAPAGQDAPPGDAIDDAPIDASLACASSAGESGQCMDVSARVEWHPPDFQNNKVHRGVTLYEPI